MHSGAVPGISGIFCQAHLKIILFHLCARRSHYRGLLLFVRVHMDVTQNVSSGSSDHPESACAKDPNSVDCWRLIQWLLVPISNAPIWLADVKYYLKFSSLLRFLQTGEQNTTYFGLWIYQIFDKRFLFVLYPPSSAGFSKRPYRGRQISESVCWIW